MKNWVEIVVGVYLLAMVLYGHHRGLIKLIVSMTAMVITLIAVHVSMPYVTSFVKEKTPVKEWIVDAINDGIGQGIKDRVDEAVRDAKENIGSGISDKLRGLGIEPENLPDVDLGKLGLDEAGGGLLQGLGIIDTPAQQRQVIEELPLPDEIKDLLIENNNNEVYSLLGVDAFTEYLSNYLAGLIIHIVCYVVLFIIIFIALHIVAAALDLVAKLPVLSDVNKLGGALLGGVQGLIFLWIAALLLTACSGMHWAASILEQVQASVWLSFLYRYNLVSRIVLGILKGLIA